MLQPAMASLRQFRRVVVYLRDGIKHNSTRTDNKLYSKWISECLQRPADVNQFEMNVYRSRAAFRIDAAATQVFQNDVVVKSERSFVGRLKGNCWY